MYFFTSQCPTKKSTEDTSGILGLGPQTAPTELQIDVGRNINVVMNWSNLTIFTGRRLSLDETFRVLRVAPRLINCTQFDLDSSTLIPPNGYSPMTHSSLEDLTLFIGSGKLEESINLLF